MKESIDNFQSSLQKNTFDPSVEIRDLYQAACFKLLSTIFPGVIHDIRGHLNNIVINLELTKNAIEMIHKQTSNIVENNRDISHFDTPIKQIYNLDKSIQLLLEIVDTTPGRQVSFNMINILEEVYSLIKTTIRLKRIKFIWQPYQSSILVSGEKSAMRHSLLHILMAVVDCAKVGGTVYGNSFIENNDFIFSISGNRSDLDEEILSRLFNTPLEKLIVDRNTAAVYVARNILAVMGCEALLKIGGDAKQLELWISAPSTQDHYL